MKTCRFLTLGIILFAVSLVAVADVNSDFISAVESGSVEDVKRLIEAGAEIDYLFIYQSAASAGYGSTGKKRTYIRE